MENKMKIRILLPALLVLTILCLANVAAFGVTSPYWKDRPLEVTPGQIVDMALELQNMAGEEEDITVIAEIVKGAEIIEITDENKEYLVPFGSKDIKVNIKITIPADAIMGKEYTAILSFTTITPGEPGVVAMGSSVEKEFPIIIKSPTAPAEEPADEKAFPALLVTSIIIVVIIIILIIWLLTRKKPKKKA